MQSLLQEMPGEGWPGQVGSPLSPVPLRSLESTGGPALWGQPGSAFFCRDPGHVPNDSELRRSCL